MADHGRSSTNHQRSTHSGQSRNLERSGLVISLEDRHLDSHKFENRSDRDDSYDYSHGSFRTAREDRALHTQSDRGRHSQYDYASNHRYSESEDRLSGSVMKDHSWTSHDRPKTINGRSHERFNRDGDIFYGRESSNGLRNTNRNTANERRLIREQERYDRKDEPKIVHERQHPQKSYDNYKQKEEEQECREAKSPAACYSSSDVISLKARYKDRGNSDNLDEHMEQHPYTTDRRSESHQPGLRHNSSRGRPSSRGSSSRSLSSASDGTGDSRGTNALKEGSSLGRRLSIRDRRRSPSPSGSPSRSESRHSGIRSKSHSSVKKDSRSSHSHKHSSGKRKHRDRSASPDDRKRRKRKEREREKDKEISRERKKDEERRSVLTGKKIKLKVKKDKGDHERDANRKDLLQFLNSAFE